LPLLTLIGVHRRHRRFNNLLAPPEQESCNRRYTPMIGYQLWLRVVPRMSGIVLGDWLPG
jgi:hypothetical protein